MCRFVCLRGIKNEYTEAAEEQTPVDHDAFYTPEENPVRDICVLKFKS